MEYTDDTAMTKSICESLLKRKKFDPVDIATRFAKEYKTNPNRGYGMSVVDIFQVWQSHKIKDENVYTPSLKQFNGSGSYGNGGAMRVSPVALVTKTTDECLELARQTALLTHSNRGGFVGAMLQALAVFKALHTTEKLKWKEYLNELRADISKIESDLNSKANITESKTENDFALMYDWTRSESFSYAHQLGVVEKLLQKHFDNPDEDDKIEIAQRLGKDVSAQQSVPAAIYSFLRSVESGSFEETLYYALSLGGDTDTIGSMCAAIAGAYYGYEHIHPVWREACEAHNVVMKFADEFYKLY